VEGLDARPFLESTNYRRVPKSAQACHPMGRVENIHMIKARQVDEKRRITLPTEFLPGTDVILERVDSNTWIIQRHVPNTRLKMVSIPVIKHLPDDPEWDKVEEAFGRAVYNRLPPPEED
jgi:hypothetical protein